MQYTIKKRWDWLSDIIVEIGAEFATAPEGVKLGAAVKVAFGARADLTRADLTRADLTGADLTGAVLTRAVLTGADLTRAVLTGADLRGADLTRAVLTGADLRGADLTGADLTGADLTRADLTRAVLTGADLRGAVLTGVPVIAKIDTAILAAIEAGGKLEMGAWHTCETTHCRAGWAVTLAGAGGAALEFAMGPAAAGALIYAASRPGQPVPNFYESNEDALADLRAGAEREAKAASAPAQAEAE